MKVPKTGGRSLDHNRQSVVPINMPPTLRGHMLGTLTTLAAGRMVPLAVAPILREDSVRRGQLTVDFEMQETEEILMNSVHAKVKAYFVPYLAFERFNSMDELNRSYKNVPLREGEQPVPFFETIPKTAEGTDPILESLGLHAKEGDDINTAYYEAYNIIWNFLATNRSLSIEHRERLDKTLAPAFWNHQRYKHIVPDFDQALNEGEVALNIANAKIPIKGIGAGNQIYGQNNQNVYETGETAVKQYASSSYISGQNASFFTYLEEDPDNPGFPGVFAEMQQNGITVSLANIEAAKKTAAFAKLREKYNGHDDEYIIDLLMSGLSVPEQHYKQPMLLASQETIFGVSKRYASDAANLTESVVNGQTSVQMNIRLPRVPMGGLIMIVAECLPDQLFERQQDPLLSISTVDDLPQADRDHMDPEKVDVVYNNYVDVDHDTPSAVFGYEPMNAKWDIKAYRIGGDFYRPLVDGAFDEDRNYFWSNEVQNPTLSEDFYLSTTVHTKPFAGALGSNDPFRALVRGQLVIQGLTQFGPALIEASDNYEKVLENVPTETIEK